MQKSFLTFANDGEFELTEKKSRFIGRAKSVSGKKEAEEFISFVTKSNPDARHTVFAYRVLSENSAGMSDDGEPHGTGGKPVMAVLEKRNIDNAVITVTRYFGGILLGAPGLVRAYSSAASGAADNAGLCNMVEYTGYSLSCSYDNYGKIIYYLDSLKVKHDKPVFSDKVLIQYYVSEGADTVSREIFDICGNNNCITESEKKFFKET